MSEHDRRNVVYRKRCCWICLSVEHKSGDCKSMYRCTHCNNKHHTLLYSAARSTTMPSSSTVTNTVSNSESSAVTKPDSAMFHSADSRIVSHANVSEFGLGYSVLLATALVKLYSQDGRSTIVRALLDQGSEVSLLSEKAAQLLRVQRVPRITRISGVNGIVCTVKHIARIGLGHKNSSIADQHTDAVIVPKITQLKPARAVNPTAWTHLHGLSLADPNMTSSDPIDVIIGAELFGCILRNGVKRGPVGTPTAQQTTFEWIVSGRYRSDGESITVSVHATVLERLDETLRTFWQIKSIPSVPLLTTEEQECEEYFYNTVSRDSDGRYIVRLPFRSDFSGKFGDSRAAAIRCLQSAERCFEKDAARKSAYSEFMREYEMFGHMTRVTSSSNITNSREYFIPHHAMFRMTNGLNKIRVVFNASRKSSDGNSLNDHLLIGPRLQLDLPSIIINWRVPRYVLTADITKMYRQIKVDPQDTPFRRIVWRDSPSLPISDFELTTVTYGTASAPFLALRVLKKLATDEGHSFPRAKSILQRSTYVDDCFFSADSVSEALAVREELIALLARAQMPLAKWSANDDALLSGLNLPVVTIRDKAFTREETIHILGISWNSRTDSFYFNVSETTFMPPTKWSILSTIAKIFDPLGWLSPVIICAKIFIQTLWSAHLDWDNALSDELIQLWRNFHEQLPLLRNVSIPRWVGTAALTGIQLHGFCDASSRAYAAVIYVRVQTRNNVRVSLLFAKTKVAPCQTLTIPRLELCATQLLAKSLQFVIDSLAITNPRCYCWSHSMVVLAWLKSSPANWKTFVANWVSDIQRRIPSAEWRHVGTAENPADCASRGVRPQEFLEQSNWWVGPSWLVRPSTHWPNEKAIEAPSDVELEQHVSIHAHVRSEETWDVFRRFSSWSRLVRVTALLYRVAARARKTPFPNELTVVEFERAREFWLKYIQRNSFSDAIASINATGSTSSRELVHLSPFVDADGWLRVRGRLEKNHAVQNAKQPLLLKSHYVVRLLIRGKHTELFHCGPALLLATLRREFWILRPRPLIRSVLYGCTICARYRAQPAQ